MQNLGRSPYLKNSLPAGKNNFKKMILHGDHHK